MTVRVVSYRENFVNDLDRAMDDGLEAAAIIAETRIKVNLSKPGTPTSKTGRTSLARGRTLLSKRGSGTLFKTLRKSPAARDNFRLARSIERLGGLVDPPGGMPRLRTGNLRRGISHAQKAKHNWSVGVLEGVPYARIHEFGGMAGKGRGTYIPARPYLRPSMKQASDAMNRAFVAHVESVMSGGAP